MKKPKETASNRKRKHYYVWSLPSIVLSQTSQIISTISFFFSIFFFDSREFNIQTSATFELLCCPVVSTRDDRTSTETQKRQCSITRVNVLDVTLGNSTPRLKIQYLEETAQLPQYLSLWSYFFGTRSSSIPRMPSENLILTSPKTLVHPFNT